MPLVAIGREVGTFLAERIGLERWPGGPITVQVPVAVHDPPPPERESEELASDPNLSED
jgi:hypothetical protein